MLVICTKDGVTVGSKLYMVGDVFVLAGVLETEYAELTDERWMKKQNKVYGEILFRRPTADELRKAIAEKKISEADIKGALDKKQFKIAMEYLKSKHLAQAKAAEAFIEKTEMEVYEGDAEEEKAEIAEEEKAEIAEEEEAPKEEAPVKEPPKKIGKGKGKKK